MRQKVENKRFNKALDRVLGAVNALALGILGYGSVKEALDGIAGSDPFDLLLFGLGAGIGFAMLAAVTYVTYQLTRRED